MPASASADEPSKADNDLQAESKPSNLLPRFPDFGHMPGADQYHGRVFKLSQDYPEAKPELDDDVKAILEIDFYKDWERYVLAVRDYIYEGNIERDGNANDFYLEDNPVRNWYHVPWQHWGNQGREGIHGLTKEGPVNPRTLSPAQNTQYQTYAVGFYNEPGGWTIGRVWKDAENPDVATMALEGFPVGTVVGKVLFTTAPVSEVPFLSNPIQWPAFVTTSFKESEKREMSTVRFIQMDIMVRDSRADKFGGWVFSTFVYNGDTLSEGNMWYNTVPVGIMWGNDPDVKSHSESNPAPVKTIINPDLRETVINTAETLPPMHLGWGLRLNGPLDNTMSSCMSCHATSQYPAVSGMLPAFVKYEGKSLNPDSPQWMRWFRNVPCATPFDPQAVSMDYSLQLAASIQNFVDAKAKRTGGLYYMQYFEGEPVHSIRGQRGRVPEDDK